MCGKGANLCAKDANLCAKDANLCAKDAKQMSGNVGVLGVLAVQKSLSRRSFEVGEAGAVQVEV